MLRVQKGGKESTNIQTETVTMNYGVTYEDAKSIALDVFRANFMQLSEQAAEVAKLRAEEITDTFLRELEKQNKVGIMNAQDPDFQYALFTIQKEYARTGDKDLGDLLVDLLVDRTKHGTRTVLQIVLNESLSIAPKLTQDQISALSIMFLVGHTVNNTILSIQMLLEYFDTHFSPLASLLSKNQSCYQHLQYAGCGSISIGQKNIIDILKRQYSGLFSKGFTEEEAIKTNIRPHDHPKLFISCLHDPTKIQVNAISESALREKAHDYAIAAEDLVSLNNNSLMDNEEIRSFIVSARGYMRDVFEIWDDSYMKNFTLTSVGIAIGHANVKRTVGEFTDLGIWIN